MNPLKGQTKSPSEVGHIMKNNKNMPAEQKANDIYVERFEELFKKFPLYLPKMKKLAEDYLSGHDDAFVEKCASLRVSSYHEEISGDRYYKALADSCLKAIKMREVV